MTTPTTQALEPCPFCGCTIVDIRKRKTVIIECDDCKALMIHSDESEAIAAWNRRSPALAAIEADRDKREGGIEHILTESPFPEITGRTDKDVLRMCRAFLEDMHTMPVNWTISASVWLMNEVSNALNSSATRDGCVEMPREPSMAIVSAMKAQVQMKTTEAYKVYFAAIATAEKEKL